MSKKRILLSGMIIIMALGCFLMINKAEGATENFLPNEQATPEPTSAPDGKVTKEDNTRIDRPQNPVIEKSLEKNVVLSWDKQDGAQKYNIYRSKQKKTGYEKIGTTRTTKFTDKKAKKRNTYYYKVTSTAKEDGVTYESKFSKRKQTYVIPAVPRTVIAGECFVDGMKNVSSMIPSNIKLVPKIGVNTYSMQHSNYFTYKGKSVTGIEKVASYKPDRVYFLIGANEAVWMPLESTMSNFGKMIKLLKSQNRNVEVVLVAIPPFGNNVSDEYPSVELRKKFNDSYKDYAEKTKNVYYSPATDVLADGTSHLMKKYDDGDGCHWNDAGTIEVLKSMEEWSNNTFGNW